MGFGCALCTFGADLWLLRFHFRGELFNNRRFRVNNVKVARRQFYLSRDITWYFGLPDVSFGLQFYHLPYNRDVIRFLSYIRW